MGQQQPRWKGPLVALAHACSSQHSWRGPHLPHVDMCGPSKARRAQSNAMRTRWSGPHLPREDVRGPGRTASSRQSLNVGSDPVPSL